MKYDNGGSENVFSYPPSVYARFPAMKYVIVCTTTVFKVRTRKLRGFTS